MHIATPLQLKAVKIDFERLFDWVDAKIIIPHIHLFDVQYLIYHFRRVVNGYLTSTPTIVNLVHALCWHPDISFGRPLDPTDPQSSIAALLATHGHLKCEPHKFAAIYRLRYQTNMYGFDISEEQATEIMSNTRRMSHLATYILAFPQNVFIQALSREQLCEICLADGQYLSNWHKHWCRIPSSTQAIRHIKALLSLHNRGKIDISEGLAEAGYMQIDPLQICYNHSDLKLFEYFVAHTNIPWPSSMILGTHPAKYRTLLKRQHHMPSIAAMLHIILSALGPANDSLSTFLQIYNAVPPELQHLICMQYSGFIEDFIPHKDLENAIALYSGRTPAGAK